MKKKNIIICSILLLLVMLAALYALFLNKKDYDNNTIENQDEKQVEEDRYYEKRQKLAELPQEIKTEEAIENGYFVYDGKENKVYNEKILTEFIRNAEEYPNNRKSDEIIIAIYNIDGYLTLYNLEYEVDENDKNKTKYILITDPTRNLTNETGEIISREMTVNDNIPGEYYRIAQTDDYDFRTTTISLIIYDEENINIGYEEIEIVKYSLDAEVVK